ncbi:STAS domain-containing protein [Bacillus manliponensis]
MDLVIEIHQDELKYNVKIAGEIDAHTAADLKKRLMVTASEKNAHIIVDFTEVTYMDSTGLGVFIALLKAVKKNHGHLEFVGVSRRLKRLFDITGLTEILKLNAQYQHAERE